MGDAGNDSLPRENGADIIDGGGDGADRVAGGAEADSLWGGDGSDKLSGGAGDDALDGDFGNGALTGANSADQLSGGLGNDGLEGGWGADDLTGDDDLNGGSGNDLNAGGAGVDRLTGSAGADVFLFASTAEIGLLRHDTISDFEAGEDRIDLTALNLTWVGTAAFSGTGAALRFTRGALQIDADGDGAADAILGVKGERSFDPGDLLL